MSQVKPIPDGYHSVTPYLIIGEGKASKALDFYTRAFGAKEVMRMPRPEGGLAHAEMQVGDSKIMLSDESPKLDAYGPNHYGGSPVTLHVYVPDVDATAKQATAAGAKLIRPVADQIYGDRTAGFHDPFGHRWYFATHIREVSMEEMQHQMHATTAG
ncbi:MAG TPA: VOC family protein [Terracidiphilus sp.]|nr:VOC family protein [Terracidiphilus sp.]